MKELQPAEHTAIPDRIEAGTWAAAAVATRGDVVLDGARHDHLELFLEKLAEGGAEIRVTDEGLRVRQAERTRAADFVTLPYPGLATDFQPILLAMLATANGTSIATENVFEGRFTYVDELRRMGADIRTEGHHAVIRGVEQLSAAPVRAMDIRAGAAMAIAALTADGVSEIADIDHVDRGYEDFEAKLTGARCRGPARPRARPPPVRRALARGTGCADACRGTRVGSAGPPAPPSSSSFEGARCRSSWRSPELRALAPRGGVALDERPRGRPRRSLKALARTTRSGWTRSRVSIGAARGVGRTSVRRSMRSSSSMRHPHPRDHRARCRRPRRRPRTATSSGP